MKIKKLFQSLLIVFFIFFSNNGVAGEVAHSPALSDITILDLQTAQKIALRDNPDMAAAMSRVDQARSRIDQAGAAWWPSLDLSMSGSRTRISDSNHAAARNLAMAQGYGQLPEQTRDDLGSSLQATWIMFDGFYRKFREQQAEINEQTIEADHQNSRRLIVAAVAESFLNAQLAEANFDIARANEEFYQRQLSDARNRYEAGVGSWGDVINIRVQLNSAKTNLIFFERSIEASEYELAALMGIRDSLFPKGMKLAILDEKEKISVEVEENRSDELIRKALSTRADIASLEFLLQEVKAGQGMIKSRFYPTVRLVGAVDGTRQDNMPSIGDDFSGTIRINASWNLFAGGIDKARVFESRQKEREVGYGMTSLRNSIVSEVRQNLALLAAAREQVRLQRESVELVKENREMARSEYEAGEAPLIRLNEAQRDLNRTLSQLAVALVSYHKARHRLLAATGTNIDLLNQQ